MQTLNSDRIKKIRVLLKELVYTDFKLRYQGSVLGYAWSLLKPLFTFGILYTVFTLVFKIGRDVPNFQIYLLLGIVLWNFFTEITQQSLLSIVSRGDLIRKIRIPRWLIVLSVSIGALVNLMLNLLVVLVFAIIARVGINWGSLMLFVYILEIYVFALGLSFLLAAAYVKYRDLSYIWDIALQAGFYLTPIVYPLTLESNLVTNQTILKLLFLSPVAQAVQGARNALVTQSTITMADIWSKASALAIPMAVVSITLLVSLLYFKKEARTFAENV